METIAAGLLIFCAAASFAIVGLLVLKKFVDLSSLASHQDLVQATLQIVGTLYAVLLGFLVAGAVSFHEAAEARVLVEANSLCDIFRFAKGLPDPQRSIIRNTCRNYNKTVLTDEWSDLEQNQACPNAWKIYYSLWDEVLALPNGSQTESNIQSCLMNAVETLGESRRSRVTMMKHHLPALVWLVVITGSAILTCLMYLLVGDKKLIHSILIATVTGVLCLNALLLYVYSQPFRGALKVKPQAFEVNQEMFEQSDQQASYAQVFGQKNTAKVLVKPQ